MDAESRVRRWTAVRNAALPALAVAAALAVFYPVTGFDFVNYDDPDYVTQNAHTLRGLTAQTVRAAFTQAHNASWHPLAMMSHALDISLFGLRPGAHHAVNLALHLLNIVFVYVLGRRLLGDTAAATILAVLFAVHPLQVEPVAWISSRKDVLGGTFTFLTVLSYLAYATRRTPIRYGVTAALFTLAVLAKPSAVGLPIVLAAIDFWPLGRRGIRAQWDKLPLLLLSAAYAAATVHFQSGGGAVRTFAEVTAGERIWNAVMGYASYFRLAIWPAGLSPHYPYVNDPAFGPGFAFAAALLAGLAGAAWGMRARCPALLVGLVWFAVLILPTSGIVAYGGQRMAGRYMYSAIVGLLLIAVFPLTRLRARAHPAYAIAATVCGGALMALSSIQVQHWRNSLSLFTYAATLAPESALVQNNLGEALLTLGDVNEAERRFHLAIEAYPGFATPYYNLGVIAGGRGDFAGAAVYQREAIARSPQFGAAHNNLGTLLARSGDIEQAREHFEIAAGLMPDNAMVQYNLGKSLNDLSRFEEAILPLRRAMALEQGAEPGAIAFELGRAFAGMGDHAAAIAEFDRVLAAQPGIEIVVAARAASLEALGAPREP